MEEEDKKIIKNNANKYYETLVDNYADEGYYSGRYSYNYYDCAPTEQDEGLEFFALHKLLDNFDSDGYLIDEYRKKQIKVKKVNSFENKKFEVSFDIGTDLSEMSKEELENNRVANMI